MVGILNARSAPTYVDAIARAVEGPTGGTIVMRPANGKAQRSNRTDDDEFCGRLTFRSASELRRALREWETEYNYAS